MTKFFISGAVHQPKKWERLVNVWLITGAVMLAIQIVLGGVTRLTGSGLSITEWQPLLGIIPPLSERSWQQSFHAYQQIAQYKKLNYLFTLNDYQHIYFWEWLHREWARLIAVVFIGPFILLALKRQISRRLATQLFILFLLGALQGLIGWIMVKTGLNDTATAVSPVALAVHFMSAIGLFSYLVLIAAGRILSTFQDYQLAGWKKILLPLIIILLLVQLVLGAFMSGMHAALYAPTWPDMNGKLIPSELSITGTPLRSLYPLWVQFLHRNLAYLISILIVVWLVGARSARRSYPVRYLIRLPFALVFLQVILGIFTLLNSGGPHLVLLGSLHQLVAIVLLASLLVNLTLQAAKQPGTC